MARKLKAALAKFQAEQKVANHKAAKERHAEKIKLDQKAAKEAKRKAAQANIQHQPPWLPFEDSTEETVVLVGEGDFSFGLDFVDKFPNINIISTSLDSREEVLTKYEASAPAHLQSLEELEIPLLHNVDATQLSKNKALAQQLAHEPRQQLTVIFNFPHLGNSVSDQDRNIRQHQSLILSFFKQCKAIGAQRVVVSLFDGEPYNSWQPKQLARSAGYHLVRSGRFPWSAFPHYQHQLTLKGGGKTSKAQRQRDARIYLWTAEEPKRIPSKKSKEAHRDDSEDSD